jgi:hypothetical protein
MTSPDQQGQPSRDEHEPLEHTRQLGGRSRRSRRKSARLWIGLSVIAVVGLAGALISIATGGTHQDASSVSSLPGATSGTTNSTDGGGTVNSTDGGTVPKGTSTVPKGTSTAKAKVVSAAQLAENGGAISVPASSQSSAASWQSGPGGRDLTAVSSRLGAALQAGGIRQYAQMKYACGQLASSVATAQAGPQIPDAAMQKLYTTALAELAKGAANCQTAISVKPEDESVETHVDTAMLNLSTSELSAGATDVFRSTAEIEIISRQHH